MPIIDLKQRKIWGKIPDLKGISIYEWGHPIESHNIWYQSSRRKDMFSYQRKILHLYQIGFVILLKIVAWPMIQVHCE